MIGNSSILPFGKIPARGKGVVSLGFFGLLWSAFAPEDLALDVVSDVAIDIEWTNVDTKGDGVSIERTAVAGGGSGWTD